MKYYFIYNLSDGIITQHFTTELANDTWDGMPDTMGILACGLDDEDAQKLFNDPTLYKYVVQNGKLVQTATDEELLELAKSKQINIILNQYVASQNNAVFKSSAIGAAYTYVANPNAKTRYDAIYARFHNDPTYMSEEIYTVEGGYIEHNKDQFTQVWIDGFASDKAIDGKYRGLVSQINAIQLSSYGNVDDAIADVQKITWE